MTSREVWIKEKVVTTPCCGTKLTEKGGGREREKRKTEGGVREEETSEVLRARQW